MSSAGDDDDVDYGAAARRRVRDDEGLDIASWQRACVCVSGIPFLTDRPRPAPSAVMYLRGHRLPVPAVRPIVRGPNTSG